MNSSDSGVRQYAATVVDRPTTATTSSSRPARAIVRRNTGSVSIRPSSGSTRLVSWCSQPAWFSSEPRWWSRVKTTLSGLPGGGAEVDRRLAAVGPHLQRGTHPEVRHGSGVQERALVLGHEPLGGAGVLEQLGGHPGGISVTGAA